MNNYDCCQEINSNIIKKEENGKSFIIINKNRNYINVCKVDGCLIIGSTKRCDYLFINGENELYLVELKGNKVVDALHQIISSAENIDLVKNFKGKKYTAIVGNFLPRSSTSYQNELSKLSSKFKLLGLEIPIKPKNRCITVEIV